MRTQSFWVVLAGATLAACGGGGTGPRADLYRDLPADYVMLNVNHYLTDDGVRRGILDADTAFVYVDSATVDLRKVHLLLYGTDGKDAADLVSRTGQLNQRTNAMVARGAVVLVAKTTADRIETEELHYDPNVHRVWSTVRTTRIQNGNRVTADGFTADDQMRNVEMTRPRGRVEGLKVNF
jgi:LPS export ABC transporter protein LptC